MDRTIEIETLLNEAGWLRRLAAHLVGDNAQADDLVQDTWVAALRQPPSAEGEPRPWLSRVARNLVRNDRRDRARREAREAFVQAERESPEPATLAQEAEAQRLLAEAVTRLAEPLRSVVVLRYFQGLDSTAISARLGLPASTVRTRLQKALEELRAGLDRRFEGGRGSWGVFLSPLLRNSHTGAGVSSGTVTAAATSLTPWPILLACASAACVLAAVGANTWRLTHEGGVGASPPAAVLVADAASVDTQETASHSLGERQALATRAGAQPVAEAERDSAGASPSEAREVSGLVLVDGRPPEWPVQLSLEPRISTAPVKPGEMRRRVRPMGLTLAPEERGAFNFVGLSPGWSGRLRVSDFTFADGGTSVDIDAPVSDLVLDLRSGPAVVGRIRGPDGLPIPGLTGSYQLRTGSEGQPPNEPTTAEFICRADGCFRIPSDAPAVPGAPAERASLSILVEAEGHGYLRHEVPNLVPAQGIDLGDLVLEPLRALEFTAREPDGTPIAGVFARVDGPFSSKWASLTGVDGHGVLAMVPDRSIDVRFAAFGHADRVLRADPGNALEVVLEPLAVLDVHLLVALDARTERVILSADRSAFIWDESGWDERAEFQIKKGKLFTRRVPAAPGQRFEYEFRTPRGGRLQLAGLTPDVFVTVEALDYDGRSLAVETISVAGGQRAEVELGENFSIGNTPAPRQARSRNGPETKAFRSP